MVKRKKIERQICILHCNPMCVFFPALKDLLFSKTKCYEGGSRMVFIFFFCLSLYK